MNKENIISELEFKAVRSSGAGGQHVNKVSSKVILSFDVQNSESLREDEKELLYLKIASRLTLEKVLILACDDSRSQHQNKEAVIERFLEIIKNALIIPKTRRSTKPTRSSVRKNSENKIKHSRKKNLRRKPGLE